MIFAEPVDYLPEEQSGVIQFNNWGFDYVHDTTMPLPDGSTVTLARYQVNHFLPGGVIVIWKVKDDWPLIDPAANYSDRNSIYADPANLIDGHVYSPYASGRCSYQLFYTNISIPSYTWRNTFAPRPFGVSLYNDIDHGGHVGILYVPDNNIHNPPSIFGFGSHGEGLDWVIATKVIGKPIYPTRAVSSPYYGVGKKEVTTTAGLTVSHPLTDREVFRGTIQGNADDTDVVETLKLVAERDKVLMIPSGLDDFPEDCCPRVSQARDSCVTWSRGLRAVTGMTVD